MRVVVLVFALSLVVSISAVDIDKLKRLLHKVRQVSNVNLTETVPTSEGLYRDGDGSSEPDCDEDGSAVELADILQGVYGSLTAEDQQMVAMGLYYTDIDLTHPSGVLDLACRLEGVHSLESMINIFNLPHSQRPPNEHDRHGYDRIVSAITSAGGITGLRTYANKLIAFFVWVQTTNFPNVPLRNTDIVSDWKFFTKLQDGFPSSLLGVPPLDNTRRMALFTQSPERIVRVIYGAQSADEIDSAFGFPYIEIQHAIPEIMKYLPVTVRMLEVIDRLIERGWLDF